MSQQLNIGFIQAKNKFDVHYLRPLAYGYLKSYLGEKTDIPFRIKYFETIEAIENCDVIGISSTSQDFDEAKNIARTVKEKQKDIITVLGGHHITCLPQTLSHEFDIGVMGEGEQTFLELIQHLSANNLKLNKDDLIKINGIVYKKDDKIITSPSRDFLDPLDSLPFPYRDEDISTYLLTSRGCPYKCLFCGSSAFWKKTRFFSADYVIMEIEHLIKRFPLLKRIFIWDDLFVADKKRLKEIVRLIVEKGIDQKLGFDLAVRADLVSDELCNLLKKMNAVGLSFGVESGSDRILKYLRKDVSKETNQRAIDIIHKYGFTLGCSFIVGCPTETEKEVRSTYELALKNILDNKINVISAINILNPIPGTKLWDDAVSSGLIDIENMDWKRLSVFASYRNSAFEKFHDWVQFRRNNNSIYLNENTLPQERLYEIMYEYEDMISKFEEKQKDEVQQIGNATLGKTNSHPNLFGTVKTPIIMKPIRAFVFLSRLVKKLILNHFIKFFQNP